MNDPLRSSGRTISIDQAVRNHLADGRFVNHQFKRLVALKKIFTDCNFSYSTFDASYLRNCTFNSCNFTGCKFINTNLRGSHFIGCQFDYVQFNYTYVDPEILDKSCPGQENLQQAFARTLRMNFSQIGDTVAANKAIRIELQATRIHLYKAWRSRESYYRSKYTGTQRIKVLLRWSSFIALDLFWGNGESVIKLLRSLAIITIMVALGDVFFLRDLYIISNYESAILQAPEILLGITAPNRFSGLILAVIASARFIMFACLVSILVKRMSRR